MKTVMEPENERFTAKEELFCYEYCIDFNAAQAAIRAGYSERTARSIGCKLLTKVNIQNKIKDLKGHLSETAGIGALKVLNEHKKIAFSSIAHLHNTWIQRKELEELTEDQKSCIAEIDTKIKTEYEYDADSKEKEPIRVEYVRIKLYDKQKALDSISKMLGYEAPTRNEISGKLDLTKMSDEQLDSIIDRLSKQCENDKKN